MPIALELGNPGETIPVLLDNGRVATFICGNVVNTGYVQVHGGHVFGGASPSVQIEQKDIFKTKTKQSTAEPVQLVAVSLWSGEVPLSNFNDVLPWDIAPYNIRTYEVPWQSWIYDENLHACVATENGDGDYATEETCLSANGTSRLTPITPDIRYNEPPIDPYYQQAVNGDRVIPSNSRLGYFPGGIYSYVQDVFFSAGQNTWYHLKVNDSVLGLVTVTKKLSDSVNDAPGFFFVNQANGRALARKQEFLPFDVRSSDSQGFGIKNISSYPPEHYLYINKRGGGKYGVGDVFTRNFSTEIGVDDIRTIQILEYFDILDSSRGNAYYARTQITTQYLHHSGLKGLFLKLHDPDLPTIKVSEYEFPLRSDEQKVIRHVHLVNLGDRFYLIIKRGKLRNPDIPFEQREWAQIEITKIAIASEELNIEYKNTFFHPSLPGVEAIDINGLPLPEELGSIDGNLQAVADLDNPTSSISLNFAHTVETENPCIDDETYFIPIQGLGNRYNLLYQEVNYQASTKGSDIIVYKVPGYVFALD